MSDTPKSTIDPMFIPLLPTFMVELRKRHSELKKILGLSGKQELKKEDLAEMAAITHKIAGSSAPFGYPELSVQGKALEIKILETPNEHKIIVEDLRTLVAACNDILANNSDIEASPAPIIAERAQTINRALPLILLADDDAVIRGMMSSVLSGSFTLISCETAHRCFELARERQPDLILLDNQMPGNLSGLMLLPQLKKDPKTLGIPVMMLTANGKGESVKHALMNGSVDYIIKPLNAERTLNRIKHFLQNKNKSILIVDDDMPLCALLKQQFQAVGLTVLVEEHGERVVTLIKQKKPSLVILDRNLPDLNGAQILASINEDTSLRNTPIVFLTADSEEENIHDGLAQGAVDYILKPFEPKDVVTRCLKILDRPKKRADSFTLSHLFD